MKVLIIEDNKRLVATISDKLRKEYVVDVAYTGDKGEYLIYANEYDIILLDLNLPDMDGAEVCKKVRSNGCKVPILALTGRSNLSDKVHTLDMGADDYLTKPFEFEELFARMRSLLRRNENSDFTSSRLVVDGLSIDIVSREVTVRGKCINLRQKEFQLLEYLMRNQGRVVTRNQIIEHVWDTDTDPVTNTVDVHINSLRRKIANPFIKTVHGIGYKIKA
jgi:two-component system, OmpR family, copper resistance phosphate regulon response regulator CusR